MNVRRSSAVTKPHRINPVFRIAVFSLFFFFQSLCTLKGEENDSFRKFLLQFPAEEQSKALSVWKELDSTLPQVQSVNPTIASDDIPDEELIALLTISDKTKLLKEIGELRNRLSMSVEERRTARQQYLKWKMFMERIENRPELGRIYMKSFGMLSRQQSLVRHIDNDVSKLAKKIQEVRVSASLNEISLSFTYTDWIVIVVYLVFTTLLGAVLAGKQSTIKDFFLGGRKLAWPAVCGSIMATELSAATFLIAPAIVFSRGGDMTYIQLAIGTTLARFIIGYFFVPAYYQREIYSPYDYMGNQLGPRVKNITSVLFMIGGVFAQGARVYIAGKAMQVITGTDIMTSILIIGAVSILWTTIGGITSVIWTDVIQFFIFSLAAVMALVYIGMSLDGGLLTVIREGMAAGKFKVINLNFNPREAYTLWCGLFATGFLTLGSHGTDQLMAQRMFTCKNPVEAGKAIVWSSTVLIVTCILLFVGAGIFIYYRYFPMNELERVIVDDDSMKVFAVYIVRVLPPVLSGFVMAAIFATAISTLDSTLAALSQATVSILYKPFIRPRASDRHYVRASRFIVILWGILLTVFAVYCHVLARNFGDLIQFALAMAAYTYGALLGTFLLAFLRTNRDDLGLMWGVPLSILTVFAFNWHQPVAQWIVVICCTVLLVLGFKYFQRQPRKVAIIGIGIGIVMLISMAVTGYTPEGRPVHLDLAWPWHYPIGTAMTFFIGYLAGNKKSDVHGKA